jgi:hypothetical protein
MRIIQFLRGRVNSHRSSSARNRLRRQFSGAPDDLSRKQWDFSLKDPTGFYLRCCHYFDRQLPSALRMHRHYFTQARRGFGEDAFHVLWFLLFREFHPSSFLEIGVYRGQTLSLASLLARDFGFNCFIQGISPFSRSGDSVSAYRTHINYYADTLENFAHFSLPSPALLRAFSTDHEARKLIASRQWAIIYIDGNHDYEIAKQDWTLSAECVQPGGLIVLDDSGLTTSYQPPVFATGGHPGPSRLAQEINRSQFREMLQVGHNRVFQKIG